MAVQIPGGRIAQAGSHGKRASALAATLFCAAARNQNPILAYTLEGWHRGAGRNGRSVEWEAAVTSLAGQLLVAMPQMLDPRFARSVVYLCAHSDDAGAMGLVINKLLGSLTMDELFAQLDIEPSGVAGSRPVHFGGPVEGGRGFVLHTADYREEATLHVEGNISVTATL